MPRRKCASEADADDASESESGAPKAKRSRAARHTWTKLQDLYLLRAVQAKGRGNWDNVLQYLRNNFHADFDWCEVRRRSSHSFLIALTSLSLVTYSIKDSQRLATHYRTLMSPKSAGREPWFLKPAELNVAPAENEQADDEELARNELRQAPQLAVVLKQAEEARQLYNKVRSRVC